ncbi:hypothetical protein KR054_003930, partial [Drosophila jambulina]
SGSSKMEFRIESVNNIPGEDETLAVFKLRTIGRQRLLNGTLTCLIDFDDTYVGAGDVFSFKNGEWIQTYVKIRTTPIDLATNYIKRYYFAPNADTNLFSEGDKYVKKGEYYFKNIPIDVENWPTFPTRGLIKIKLCLMFKGKELGGVEVIGTISDRRT